MRTCGATDHSGGCADSVLPAPIDPKNMNDPMLPFCRAKTVGGVRSYGIGAWDEAALDSDDGAQSSHAVKMDYLGAAPNCQPSRLEPAEDHLKLPRRDH